MKIRCRRCFKVYDDLECECPRCKKINDRDYTKKTKVVFSKTVSDYKMGFSKLIERNKKYHCSFCGTKMHAETGSCNFCGSNKIIRINENINGLKDKIDELVDAVFLKHMSQTDAEQHLKETIETIGEWHSPDKFKFGKRYDLLNFYIAYFIFCLVLFFYIVANVSGPLAQIVLLTLIVAPTYLLIKPLQRIMHSESLNLFGQNSFTDSEITFSERPEAARDKYETYQIDTSDLTCIIITMSGNKISKLRFISKPDANKKQLDYEIETSDYEDQNQMKRFLMLYCRMYEIMYHVQVEDLEGFIEQADKKEQYFIRRDKEIEVMTADELLIQSEYIKTLGEKVLLKGAVENQNIMILKTFTLEEAELITVKDPLVMKGKITYDIKTLDITYQTIN
ncbi:MAG: hypothetical protein JEZ08_00725 [Clostridiales bacterium]|nr:hypothetical protein [Clostridiales bacterium]